MPTTTYANPDHFTQKVLIAIGGESMIVYEQVKIKQYLSTSPREGMKRKTPGQEINNFPKAKSKEGKHT